MAQVAGTLAAAGAGQPTAHATGNTVEGLAAAAPQKDFCTDGFRSALGEANLMPLYLVVFAAFTKPLINILVFGPPRPKLESEDNSLKAAIMRDCLVLLRFALMGLMLGMLIQDLRRALNIFAAESMTFWQRWRACLADLAISPNIQAALAAWGIDDVYRLTGIWVRHHGDPSSAVQLQVRSNGGLFVIYQRVLLYTYLPLSAFFGAWAVLAAVAYVWVICPLCALLIAGHLLVVGVASRGSKPSAGAERLVQTLTAKKKSACVEELVNDASVERYFQEKAIVDKLGIPKEGLIRYLFYPIVFGPMVVIPATLAARLYSGCGYWSTLVDTWEDRHIAQYSAGILNETISIEYVLWTWV